MMKFFRLTAKHWIMMAAYIVVVAIAVFAFSYFLEKQQKKVRATIQGYLIPEPFKVDEKVGKDSKRDPSLVPDQGSSKDALTVRIQDENAQGPGQCPSCEAHQKEVALQNSDAVGMIQETPVQPTVQDPMATSSFASIAGLDNPFVMKIFQKTLKDVGFKNANLSPAGISLALAMAYEGAKGQTAQEMQSVLGFPREIGEEKVRAHQAFSDIITAFNEGDQLLCVNSAWLGKDLSILAGYQNALSEVYRAQSFNVDFCNSVEATGKINRWCAEKTNSRIKEILSETDCMLRLVLVNAIYFKAKWDIPFPKEDTQKQDFLVDENSTVQVDMMKKTDDYFYAETTNFKVLEMKYEKNRFSMIAFLPKEKNSRAILAPLNASGDPDGSWKEIMKAADGPFRRTEVIVHFPKFEFNNTWDSVKEYLQSLGMKSPFEGNADFSGISAEQPFYIGQIIQKTFIKVDEESTEAAAVTAVMMEGSAMIPEPPKKFIADHPFLYLIKDGATGTILFIGQVVDPTKS